MMLKAIHEPRLKPLVWEKDELVVVLDSFRCQLMDGLLYTIDRLPHVVRCDEKYGWVEDCETVEEAKIACWNHYVELMRPLLADEKEGD